MSGNPKSEREFGVRSLGLSPNGNLFGIGHEDIPHPIHARQGFDLVFKHASLRVGRDLPPQGGNSISNGHSDFRRPAAQVLTDETVDFGGKVLLDRAGVKDSGFLVGTRGLIRQIRGWEFLGGGTDRFAACVQKRSCKTREVD